MQHWYVMQAVEHDSSATRLTPHALRHTPRTFCCSARLSGSAMYSVKRARAGTFLRSHRRMRPCRPAGTCPQPHACHSLALSVQTSPCALLGKTKTTEAQQTTDARQATDTSGSSSSFWSMLATNLPRSWRSSGFSSCTSRVTSCASPSCCMQRLAHNGGTGAPRQHVHRQRVHYHATGASSATPHLVLVDENAWDVSQQPNCMLALVISGDQVMVWRDGAAS